MQPDSLPEIDGVTRRGFCRAGLSLAALLAVPDAGAVAFQDGTTPAKAGDEKPDEVKPVPLFDPATFPKLWSYFSAEKDNPIEKSWQVARDETSGEPYLKCLGKPYGFIRTIDEFENFEFGLQWRFPSDPDGNSGVLLYTVEPDRIWPNAIQLQLHRPKAGSVFPIGEARTDNRLDQKDRELSRALNVWNECVVTCLDGRISVVINDRKLGEVTGCVPKKGTIALQSEGSEIHFQKIWVKKITGTGAATSNA